MTKRPAPPSLAKRGLVSVSDNLLAGASLALDARAFVRLFRTEIEARGGLVASQEKAKRGE